MEDTSQSEYSRISVHVRYPKLARDPARREQRGDPSRRPRLALSAFLSSPQHNTRVRQLIVYRLVEPSLNEQA